MNIKAIAVGAFAIGTLMLVGVSAPLEAQSDNKSSNEIACFDAVQDKIPWRRDGSARWHPDNIEQLCNDVNENYSSRIACFSNGIAEHGEWERAIDDCVAVAAPTVATGTTQEQACFQAVQGKVAWNKAGDTLWSPQNVENLCKGALDYSARIACFSSNISSEDNWSKALSLCKTIDLVSTREDDNVLTPRTPVPVAASRWLQIRSLVVDDRTELGNDQVYMYVLDGKRERVRFPAVVENVYMGTIPAMLSTPSRDIYKPAYYSMSMNETVLARKTWQVCEVIETRTLVNVIVKEKDTPFTEPDDFGVNPDDLIGITALDPNVLEQGTRTVSMQGDGGKYTLTYDVANYRDNLPACTPSPVFDVEAAPGLGIADTACSSFCRDTLGGRLEACTLAPSEDCQRVGLIFFGCVGSCEADGGPPK